MIVFATPVVPRWSCCRKADLSLRQWPDGFVLFDDAQGQLQCFTAAAGEVMALLLQAPEWTSVDLAQALMGEPPTEDDVVMVEKVVLHFLSLNLVERSPV